MLARCVTCVLRTALLAAVLAVSLLNGATAARAEEAILGFVSHVELSANGDLLVTETIKVRGENRQIRRGIYRDFPTTLELPSGRIARTGFEVVSVRRDGKPERYRTETSDRLVRTYIGDPDVYLGPGEYTYELVYRSDRQIRFFETYDELYWNVTGNAWEFPILKSAALVVLPQGARALDTFAYTGRVGSKETAASTDVRAGGREVLFTTTRQLAPREGLTVGVKLPKGVIAPPTASQEAAWFWRDRLGDVVGLGGLLLCAAYYFWAWNRVGRDPAKGVLVPRWDAPDNASPALVSYIDNKGITSSDWSALSAALLSLAVKGRVVLEDLDSSLTVRTTGKQIDDRLPVGEASLMKALGARNGRLTVNKASGSAVQSMARGFSAAMAGEHRDHYYRSNTGYVAAGIGLSLVLLLAMVISGGGPDVLAPALFGVVFIGIFTSVVAANVGRAFARGGTLKSKIFSVVFVSGFAYMLTSAAFIGLGSMLTQLDSKLVYAGIAGVVALNVVFWFLMGAPTPLGRRMMDGIEGLKTYLTLAEADRMNLAGAPQMSPRHYETLLPYAVALGVEKPWSEAFDAWLATAAAAGAAAAAYQPSWYRGSGLRPGHIGESISGLPASMADSFTASLPTPKSSSSGFSGGGGSSGGGGGGGGGGGW